MWISEIRLDNIRGFIDTGYVELSKNINLFVGANNSGKSTVLNTIVILQNQELANLSIRSGAKTGNVTIIPQDIMFYTDVKEVISINIDQGNSIRKFVKFWNDSRQSIRINVANRPGAERIDFPQIHNSEPNNKIYPYLSKRKVIKYNELITTATTNTVTGNLEYLYAKIDRLCNKYRDGHFLYDKACHDIFGYPISVVNTDLGKKAVLNIGRDKYIPLQEMGDGVANLLGLIVNLCESENKIFVIEEPENDIHPKALKTLMDLIIQKSDNNQFFISTHSNIVLKYLGGVDDAKVFKIKMNIDEKTKIPTSVINEVGKHPAERMEVLEELGYEFDDYGFWKAYLFLEEASAESLIRDWFIDWFARGLKGKLKTVSTKGKNNTKFKFDNFNAHFVFMHLQDVYRNRAWVILDAGNDESAIIHELKEKYGKSGWNEHHFMQFSEHDFENYYPERFKGEVAEALGSNDKRKAKLALLEKVLEWISDNQEEAKAEFAASAKEVIEILKEIEAEVNKK